MLLLLFTVCLLAFDWFFCASEFRVVFEWWLEHLRNLPLFTCLFFISFVCLCVLPVALYSYHMHRERVVRRSFAKLMWIGAVLKIKYFLFRWIVSTLNNRTFFLYQNLALLLHHFFFSFFKNGFTVAVFLSINIWTLLLFLFYSYGWEKKYLSPFYLKKFCTYLLSCYVNRTYRLPFYSYIKYMNTNTNTKIYLVLLSTATCLNSLPNVCILCIVAVSLHRRTKHLFVNWLNNKMTQNYKKGEKETITFTQKNYGAIRKD